MTILYRIRALVRWLFRRDQIERALDSDLADYIERSAAEKVRAGLSEAEARRAARIELGGVEQTKDSVRATLSWAAIENTLADLGHALRTLRRQKTFTVVIALTLALGIGANVAIFSLAEPILLRPLPVPEPDRLVNLSDPAPKTLGWRMDPVLPPAVQRDTESGGVGNVFSYPMFRDLERAQEPFVGLAAHQTIGVTLTAGEQARPGRAVAVSGSYFSVLGLQPALGRLLGPQDDQVDGQAESVVLSHAYWQSAFAGNASVLGRALLVNGVRLTIVGVAPSGFNGTSAVSPVLGGVATVFVPITIPSGDAANPLAIPNHERRDSYWVHLFARLKPGVTREQAAAAINPLFAGILSEVEAPLLFDVAEQGREAFRTRALVLEPGARGQTNSEILLGVRIGLLGLLTLSGLVLLLCCANMAGLMLVRATARTGEMAVRASMGASRGRLASLLAAESLVLALPAALLSLPVALLILRGPSRVPGIPEDVSRALELLSGVSLSGTAVVVAIGAAVASALAVGLLPLRGLIRTEPGKTLQTYGARQTTAKGVTRFRATLATAQVALSMALLAITAALANGIANLTRIDLGVELDSVATFEVRRPGGQQYQVDQAAMSRIAEAVEAIPGVSSVASSFPDVLFTGRTPYFPVSVRGVEAEPLPVGGFWVTPDFFRLFGVRLLAGRELNDTDSMLSAAIVSQQFVERFGLSRDDVLGHTIDLGPGSGSSVIVGVVADFRSGRITEEIEPRVYLSSRGGNTFYVRSAQPPDSLMNAIRDTVARVEPSMEIAGFRTMEQQFRDSIEIERFAAGAASAFAVLATALAALGLYGVLAYSVALRSREIGLRIALGAPGARIRGMVLKQVARMAAIGVVLGAIAAWALGLAAQSLLLGVKAGDPVALAAAAALLTIVMLGAAYIPARRASRGDPMSVLRDE
ncbi:MAG TPA: ADOP family duplicated permease [Gammaproteobacteria bacterium]|nr:ADOP family duplicated permease [Gammaproteobacteria bacterium]